MRDVTYENFTLLIISQDIYIVILFFKKIYRNPIC